MEKLDSRKETIKGKRIPYEVSPGIRNSNYPKQSNPFVRNA
jgi:hypothetical protein